MADFGSKKGTEFCDWCERRKCGVRRGATTLGIMYLASQRGFASILLDSLAKQGQDSGFSLLLPRTSTHITGVLVSRYRPLQCRRM